MTTGLSSRFNILESSPHDLQPGCQSASEETSPEPSITHWVPSHFNVRAMTEDGRLVLWNTLSSAMSVFPAEQVDRITRLIRKPGVEAREEGLVEYLVERGFLISKGTNEMRKFQFVFGQQHYRTDALELILLSSEDCNFRCKYCYEKFERGTMEPWVREALKKNIMQRLTTLGRLNVGWFGGEPLYGFAAIEDLAPFFLEVAEKHDISYRSHMTTNGYLLTPEVADKLLQWKVDSYQITIDGTPEFHDCSRPTRDGRGSFDQIFENLQAMARRDDDFSIAIRVNFDQQNAPHLHSFLDLVEANFRDDSRFKLRFHAVGRWGGENDENLEVCGADSGQIMRELQEEAKRRGLDAKGSLKNANAPGSQVCYAARPFNFVVGASGKLMKCTIELDTNDRNVVGHLTREGDMKIDRERMGLWTEPAFESDTKCQSCVALPMCQGVHCPLVRIEDDRSPCTSLRLNMKRGLRNLVEEGSEPSRKVFVHGDADSEGPATLGSNAANGIAAGNNP